MLLRNIRVWEGSAKGTNVIMDGSLIPTYKRLSDVILRGSDILTVCMIRRTVFFVLVLLSLMVVTF